MKRYPWTEPGKAVTPAPEYVYNGHWNDVDYNGKIASLPIESFTNGDLGQRNTCSFPHYVGSGALLVKRASKSREDAEVHR